MSFVSSRLGGDKWRGNVQRNIRNKNVFPEFIMAHCMPQSWKGKIEMTRKEEC